MEEKEPKPNASIKRILQRISDILGRDEHAEDAPIEVYAPPEEGARLTRAFMRIKQPELRATLIKFTTQLAEVRR
jgi:hypothetical protein